MRLGKLILFCTLTLLLTACGSGSSSNTPTPTTSGTTNTTPTAPDNTTPTTPATTTAISGSAVKGPLIGAMVTAHEFDPNAENFIGDLLDEGETGADGSISGIEIPDSYTGTVILVVTADEDTIDLTTGQTPVITRLTTVISASQLSAQTPIYATPLTTIAVELAVSKAGEDSSLYPSDGEAGISEAEFLQAISSAANQTTALLGFGLDQTIDIFATPPVVNDAVLTPDQLEAATAYRTAIEGVSAVVVLLQEAAENADGNTASTTTSILVALAQDITDGDIDGESEDGVIDAITAIEADGNAIEAILTTDPNTLFIPGTTTPITQIGQLLIDEAETTSTEDTVLAMTDYTPQINTTVSDIDGDGVTDTEDAFPNDNTETTDTDNDGVGDNGDAFPEDPNESADTDEDGVGDNADAFPNDDSETIDTDSDGVGDNSDAFPEDPSESADTDEDGVGDNADAFPNDAAETIDTDSDGVGDNSDAFPEDSSESADTDEDGVGNNADAFPNNATETTDTDSDGVGDNSDAFPDDATETQDTDNDGVGDNSDAFPEDDSENADTDSDGVGDNSDNCPSDANPDQADANENDIGDACDNTGSINAVWGQSNWNESNWQ